MILGIYCSGSLGQEIYNLIAVGQVENKWDKIIFIDDVNYYKRELYKIGILSFQEVKQEFDASEIEIVVATGEPYYREQIYNKVKKEGYKLVKLISKSAICGRETIFEEGCIIFPFCYIGNKVILRSNTIIHVGAKVESNCHIGSHSFVSLGAFVGAETNIENRVFVGPNATLKDHITVKNDSIIGMGAVLVKSVDDSQVYVGNPACLLRINKNHKLFSHSIVNSNP